MKRFREQLPLEELISSDGILVTPEFKVDERNSYRTEGELTLRWMLTNFNAKDLQQPRRFPSEALLATPTVLMPTVVRRLEATRVSSRYISLITLGELCFCSFRSVQVEKNLRRYRRFFARVKLPRPSREVSSV